MKGLLSFRKKYEGIAVEFTFSDELINILHDYEVNPQELISDEAGFFKPEIESYLDDRDKRGEDLPNEIEIIFTSYKNKGNRKKKRKSVADFNDEEERVLFTSSLTHPSNLILFYKAIEH